MTGCPQGRRSEVSSRAAAAAGARSPRRRGSSYVHRVPLELGLSLGAGLHAATGLSWPEWAERRADPARCPSFFYDRRKSLVSSNIVLYWGNYVHVRKISLSSICHRSNLVSGGDAPAVCRRCCWRGCRCAGRAGIGNLASYRCSSCSLCAGLLRKWMAGSSGP